MISKMVVKGKARIAVDNHQEVMRIAERIDGWGGASRREFITAKISAGWIRKGSSVCGCLTRTDADGAVVVGVVPETRVAITLGGVDPPVASVCVRSKTATLELPFPTYRKFPSAETSRPLGPDNGFKLLERDAQH